LYRAAHGWSAAPPSSGDAHRLLGQAHNLPVILSVQHERVVSNDYVVRFENHCYQLGKPIYPGQRGGREVIELRLDGTMAIRFGGRYLNRQEVAPRDAGLGALPPRPPEVYRIHGRRQGGQEEGRPSSSGGRPSGVQPTGGRSCRTPAEPYPPDGGGDDIKRGPYRSAANHPGGGHFQSSQHADISNAV
jgi:hypothetical protein